ncbi:transposase [Bordetella genomosp. 13]|uniref:transposase n=1 Tax=Bordetella genomosp. 13 TaxID=463040 RepID=UPI0012F95014|nr:transposase [Bordetella genomosp. 13]
MQSRKSRYVVTVEDLQDRFLEIAEIAARQEVWVEGRDGRPAYLMVSHSALQQRIAPMLRTIPADHPLAAVRRHIDAVVDPQLLGDIGQTRDEISVRDADAMLRLVAFRALVLQILYSFRTQRCLAEDVAYNLLFRWFYGDQYLLYVPPCAAEIEATLAELKDEVDVGNLLLGAIAVAERAMSPDAAHFTIHGELVAQWCPPH